VVRVAVYMRSNWQVLTVSFALVISLRLSEAPAQSQTLNAMPARSQEHPVMSFSSSRTILNGGVSEVDEPRLDREYESKVR